MRHPACHQAVGQGRGCEPIELPVCIVARRIEMRHSGSHSHAIRGYRIELGGDEQCSKTEEEAAGQVRLNTLAPEGWHRRKSQSILHQKRRPAREMK
jgi:hypothetical protein